jgi:hypothetical protein
MPRKLWAAICETASFAGLLFSFQADTSPLLKAGAFLACLIFAYFLVRDPEATSPSASTDTITPTEQPPPFDGRSPSFFHLPADLTLYLNCLANTEDQIDKAFYYKAANDKLRLGIFLTGPAGIQIDLGNAVHAWVADAFDALSTAYPGMGQPSHKAQETIARLYLAAWSNIQSDTIISADPPSSQPLIHSVADQIESTRRLQSIERLA